MLISNKNVDLLYAFSIICCINLVLWQKKIFNDTIKDDEHYLRLTICRKMRPALQISNLSGRFNCLTIISSTTTTKVCVNERKRVRLCSWTWENVWYTNLPQNRGKCCCHWSRGCRRSLRTHDILLWCRISKKKRKIVSLINKKATIWSWMLS